MHRCCELANKPALQLQVLIVHQYFTFPELLCYYAPRISTVLLESLFAYTDAKIRKVSMSRPYKNHFSKKKQPLLIAAAITGCSENKLEKHKKSICYIHKVLLVWWSWKSSRLNIPNLTSEGSAFIFPRVVGVQFVFQSLEETLMTKPKQKSWKRYCPTSNIIIMDCKILYIQKVKMGAVV